MKSLFIAIVILLCAQVGVAQNTRRVPLPWMPAVDTTHIKQIKNRSIDCNEIQTAADIETFDEHGYQTFPYSPRNYDRQGRLTSLVNVTKRSDGTKIWFDTSYSAQITYHPQNGLPQETSIMFIYLPQQPSHIVYRLDDCSIDKHGRVTFYRYLIYHEDRIDTAAYHCFYNNRGQIVEERYSDPVNMFYDFKKMKYYDAKGRLLHASNLLYEYFDTLDYHYENGILIGWSGRGYSQGDECQISATCTPMGIPTGKEERWFEYEWHEDGTRTIYRDKQLNYDYDAYGNIIREVTPCGSANIYEIEYYR